MAEVFLSYANEDASRAEVIANLLEGFGATLWTDGRVGLGEDWLDEIEKRLSECDVIMPLISPDFLESKWALWEMGYALGRSKDKGVTIVPVLLRDTKVPRYLNPFEMIDARNLSAPATPIYPRSHNPPASPTPPGSRAR